MIALLTFPLFYLKEIILGAAYVAWDVLTPTSRVKPILLQVPLTLDSPRQRLLLANLITMTPGTLSVDEIDDGKTLLVHSLYGGDDPQSVLTNIQSHYQPLVAKLPI